MTIVVDPGLWFANHPDGTVLDLSQFTGQLIELEVDVEMKDGFTDIEIEFDN